MHRVALLAGFVSTGLLAPSTSHACCAGINTAAPLGWSADGHLLVGRHEAVDCVNTSVAEVLESGARIASERYDLYSRSAPLARIAEGRGIDDETLYLEEEDGGSPDRYAPSAALRRRFAIAPTTLCGADVLGLALPADRAGTDRFHEPVLLSVRVRTAAGFREVLSGVRSDRLGARAMRVLVHPSPDGTRAFVRLHIDSPDAMFDEVHWIDLPANTIRDRECELEATRAPVFPSPAFDDDSYQEDLHWMIEGASEELAAPSDGGSPIYFASEAAWTRPRDASIRALLVRAITHEFGPVLAQALELEAPLPADALEIADRESIVDALAGSVDGPSSTKPPLSEVSHLAPLPTGAEPALELDIDETVLIDPTYRPDGGASAPELTNPAPMACSATSIDATALLLVLLPLALRRKP